MDFKIETEAVLDTGIDSAQSSLRGGALWQDEGR